VSKGGTGRTEEAYFGGIRRGERALPASSLHGKTDLSLERPPEEDDVGSQAISYLAKSYRSSGRDDRGPEEGFLKKGDNVDTFRDHHHEREKKESRKGKRENLHAKCSAPF